MTILVAFGAGKDRSRSRAVRLFNDFTKGDLAIACGKYHESDPNPPPPEEWECELIERDLHTLGLNNDQVKKLPDGKTTMQSMRDCHAAQLFQPGVRVIFYCAPMQAIVISYALKKYELLGLFDFDFSYDEEDYTEPWHREFYTFLTFMPRISWALWCEKWVSSYLKKKHKTRSL